MTSSRWMPASRACSLVYSAFLGEIGGEHLLVLQVGLTAVKRTSRWPARVQIARTG